VGSEQREFSVSSALIAHQSPTLRTLIYGNFCEARNGCVTLDWVDEYTFTRFIQYAYTGDYDATGDDAVLAPVDRRPDPPKVQESGIGKEQLEPAKRRRGVERQRPATDREGLETPKKQRPETPKVHTLRLSAVLSPWNKFNYPNPLYKKLRLGQYGLLQRFSHAANRFKRTQFTLSPHSTEEYNKMFLRHAKMYVFADYYGISDLMDLSQNKLGELLFSVKLSGARLAGVIALMRYCYDEPAPEALQSFVMMYAACRAEVLWKDAGFQDLVEEIPELSLDLITHTMTTCGITDAVPWKKQDG
jgi:hypothetical protein